MPQDVYVALLVLVLLANLEAATSINHVHPNMRVPSSNMRTSSSMDSDESKRTLYSRHPPPPTAGYTGAMATLDVSSFPSLKSGEGTAALIWVSSGDHGSDLEDIQAGWQVDLAQYGDNKTHFFVYWTVDGCRSTGCFDLDCTGFVPANDAPITPGDTLEGQSKISFKIFKNKEDGDWWLHFGYDVNNMKRVGFWPKSLFTKLEDHAAQITWGGSRSSPSGSASPPMGNGQWPGKNSSTFRNVQLVDTNGQGYAPPAWALHVSARNKKCYQASPFFDDMFEYGGPGGCVN